MNFRVFRKRLSTLSDEDLILQFQKTEDQEYIAEAYNRYTALIYGICLRYLEDREISKDAASEIYPIIREKVLQFEISNFSSWLHSVTRNHCLMVLRKAKKDQNAISDLLSEIDMESESNLHQSNGHDEELINKLNDELLRLPEGQSECIRLFYYEEKSYKEIEELTGFDLKKVKSHIQNGKRNLKLSIGNGDYG